MSSEKVIFLGQGAFGGGARECGANGFGEGLCAAGLQAGKRGVAELGGGDDGAVEAKARAASPVETYGDSLEALLRSLRIPRA